MEFNADKCEVIRITSKKNPIIYSCKIHQTALRSTDQAKYLGVIITPDLSWKCHIDNITKKANSTMAFLRRNIRSSPRDAKAYKTYVRPIVEYASSVWSPAIDSHINQLEKVQRRGARFVCSVYTRQSSVSEMISSPGWDALQQSPLESPPPTRSRKANIGRFPIGIGTERSKQLRRCQVFILFLTTLYIDVF